MIRYTRKQVLDKWNKVKDDSDTLFRNGSGLFNYKGNLKDENTPYCEYISQLICKDFSVIENIGLNDEIIRKKSFNMKHNGVSDDKKRQNRFKHTKFAEEPFAIALFNTNLTFPFGEIIEYQIPLSKNKQKNIGVIDLIGQDKKDIFLIELKANSKETLLRAIIEILSFSIFLNRRRLKLSIELGLPEDINLIPTVVIYNSPICEIQMHQIEDGRLNNFKTLLERINSFLRSLNMGSFRFFSIKKDEIRLKKDTIGRTICKDNIDIQNIIEHFPINL